MRLFLFSTILLITVCQCPFVAAEQALAGGAQVSCGSSLVTCFDSGGRTTCAASSATCAASSATCAGSVATSGERSEAPDDAGETTGEGEGSHSPTSMLLGLDGKKIQEASPKQRATMVASLERALVKWRNFSKQGGTGKTVINNLEKLHSALTKNNSDAGAAVDHTQGAVDHTQGAEDHTPRSTRDTLAPQCSFAIEKSKSGAKNRRVTIKNINFFDYKDPKTNISSSVIKIRFSEDQKTWREYSTTTKKILWTLSPDASEIHMQACDSEGNWGNGSKSCNSQKVDLP